MKTKNSPASCRFPTFLPFLSCVSGGEISRTKRGGGTHLFLDLFSSPSLSPLSKKRKRKLQVRRPDWRQRAAPGREHPAPAHHRRSGGRHRAADGRARGAGGHCDRARRHALRAAGSEFGVSFLFSPGACGPRPPSPPSLARSADAAETTAEDAPPLGEKSFSRRSKKLTY